MFAEGVAARQLGCAPANTRSLSVSALGTVCHLLEAERGNRELTRISPSTSIPPLPGSLIIFQPPPLFSQLLSRIFFRNSIKIVIAVLTNEISEDRNAYIHKSLYIWLPRCTRQKMHLFHHPHF